MCSHRVPFSAFPQYVIEKNKHTSIQPTTHTFAINSKHLYANTITSINSSAWTCCSCNCRGWSAANRANRTETKQTLNSHKLTFGYVFFAGPISTADSYPDDEDNAIIDVEEDYKIPITSIPTSAAPTTTTTAGRRGSKHSTLATAAAAPVSPSGSSDEERLSPDSVQVNLVRELNRIVAAECRFVDLCSTSIFVPIYVSSADTTGAARLLQLRRPETDPVPSGDQRFVGEIPRPRHRNDHHENRTVSDRGKVRIIFAKRNTMIPLNPFPAVASLHSYPFPDRTLDYTNRTCVRFYMAHYASLH